MDYLYYRNLAAISSTRRCRSVSVQAATPSARIATKWADITVDMARLYGYILCRDCFGNCEKEECPSPSVYGKWRCRGCAVEFQACQRKPFRVTRSALLARLETFQRNIDVLRAIYFWRH